MKRLFYLTLFVTALLAASLAAAAEPISDTDADEAARIGTSNRYHFEDDFIEGEVLTPSDTLIRSRGHKHHASLITLRSNFLDFLYRQALDL